MSATTWGALTDDDAGLPVTFAWPWDPADTVTATYLSRDPADYGTDEDGTPIVRHLIDYGGDIGPQATQLRADLPVELGALTG